MENLINQLCDDEDFLPLFERMLNKKEAKEFIKELFIILLKMKKLSFAKLCIKYLDTINYGNSCTQFEFSSDHKYNPLFFASYNGNLEAVKFLVENGADIHHLSISKTTAIMYAYQSGHIDIVTYLLDNGAKIKVGTKSMMQYADPKYNSKYLELINYYDECVRRLENKISKLELETNLD